jgi:signal transduction histidine kinase/CheY-like chemotaxis protein
MIKNFIILLFVLAPILSLTQDTTSSLRINASWFPPPKEISKPPKQSNKVTQSPPLTKIEETKELEIIENDIKGLELDVTFMENLPKNYDKLEKNDLKKILIKIDEKIKKLTYQRDSLLDSKYPKKELIDSKEITINSLNKEKNIVTLTIKSGDLTNKNGELSNQNIDLKSQREKLKKVIYVAVVIILLVLVIMVIQQRKKIRTQVTQIEEQVNVLSKKNSYLEHAARIIRHDMHSGINTYIPRGISSLEKKLTLDDIQNLKIETPLMMIKDGLRHTQRAYKSVYEFTNLVKQDIVLNKTNVNLKESIYDYISNNSYSSQVDISDLGELEVNEILFCTAVENLIKNGLTYNKNEIKKIKIYLESGYIIVEDNGIGFTEKQFEKQLKRYFTNNDIDSNDKGLGLNISIAILEEHGFKLSCEKIKSGTKMKIKIKKKEKMIKSILLVDDEDLFHLVFEDACSLLDISLSLTSVKSSDEAAKMFKEWFENSPDGKPECVFVDLNIIGSSFDGIELIRKINYEYGNNVVIGIISSSDEPTEQSKALQSGAQFWIIKSDDIEPRLEEFKKDYLGYKNRTQQFKIYK